MGNGALEEEAGEALLMGGDWGWGWLLVLAVGAVMTLQVIDPFPFTDSFNRKLLQPTSGNFTSSLYSSRDRDRDSFLR
jgi:hypothetical protein